MSITKKARAALLVMLFSISILPGCGKNKNADGVGVGIAPVGIIPGQVAGKTNFVVSGQIGATGYSTFSGTLSAAGGAAPAVAPYTRGNVYDSISVYISGNTATAVVSLDSSTMTACGAGASIPGYTYAGISVGSVVFTNEIANPASMSLLYSVDVYMTNGCHFRI